MQNPKWKIRKSSIVFEKPSILSENLKILTSSNYHRAQCFLLKLNACSLLANIYKRVFGIACILFRSWVICKNQKDLVFTYSFFTFLLITQDLNKIKKSRTSFCRHCYVRKVCKISAKILNSMIVRAHQNFQFFRQITWFLHNNRSFSKFRY